MSRECLTVSSPLNTAGQYCFWDLVDTPHGKKSGKRPRVSNCEGPEYLESFTFEIPESYITRIMINKYLKRPLTYSSYQSGHHSYFIKALIDATDEVMKEAGFAGTMTMFGIARRRGKQAWNFHTSGINYRVHENFILAKLMGKESFEEQIWLRAVRQIFPEHLNKLTP